ncbi:MAG: alanine racemase, partial [Firmicutes bacterium]|nr:alanine racemase [Bacillota bacterium]
ETVCAMVKTVSAGRDVGYGATYTTSEETVIATVPVGFADGYSRSLSNKGFVVINGVRCPIIGRVCMDQFMVDATDVPGLKRGDRIELLGEGMTILDMAELLGENVDEIVCRIGKRVPRIYKY